MLGTGIQFGKTMAGAVRMKIALHTYTDSSDNFLVVAPTYKILQQSTLPAFLQVMEGCGTYNAADAFFRMHGGGTVWFRTGTDPDSIVGITNVRAIWGDEAGLFTLYFWENMQARAAFKDAPIWLTTSPYTLNWLFKEIIRPKQKDPKSNPDVELIQAASWENPYMPRGVIDRARQKMDPRRFNALFGGQWERMAGLVYDCFDEEENQCDPFELPRGTRVFGGIDWGYTDPFVLKLRAITPDGRHWGIQEVYRTQLGIHDIGTIVCGLCATWNVEVICADPSNPGYITELNRRLREAGLRTAVVPADNERRIGIDRHYELLKTRKLKYWRGANTHTLDEMDTYHYPEPKDALPDQKVKDLLPVEQNDHAMDAERYLTMLTWKRDGVLKTPFVPEEKKQEAVDTFKRLERLKRIKRDPQSESWS